MRTSFVVLGGRGPGLGGRCPGLGRRRPTPAGPAALTGQGYVELTGYAASMQGVF